MRIYLDLQKKKQEETVGWEKLNIEAIRYLYTLPGRSVGEWDGLGM
jgi:hypothetical protein